MRTARNFHPEWGYFAPMPSFVRILRIAALATAAGAIAGAVVGVSLLRPSASQVSNAPISAHALINSAAIMPSSAETLADTTSPPVGAAPPALVSLPLDATRPIEPAPAADISVMQPSAAINPEQDLVRAKRWPLRMHRSRMANYATRHRRHERGFTPSFQLPHNSTFAEFRQPCCAWTASPTRRDPPLW